MSTPADDWWHSLPEERRDSIYRWLDQGARPAPHDPEQLTIEDATEEE